ncbi:MAG: hypothetical protein WC976_06500 [Caldisericia bacterium]
MNKTNKKKAKVAVAVYLKSDRYGCEGYDYPTIDKATEGITRLLKSAEKHVLNDGITREIAIRVNQV